MNNIITQERKKLKLPLSSILLVNEEVGELSDYVKLIHEIRITQNLIHFSSSKDAYENLSLIKFKGGIGKHGYPELVITDRAKNYYRGRNFQDDVAALFPSKMHRPVLITLWEKLIPELHFSVDHYMKKPLQKESLLDLLKKHS